STAAARARRSRAHTRDDDQVKKKRAKARTQIAPGWEPTDEQTAWIKGRWFATDTQIATEAERFRAYHEARGSPMADWAAAWRTWWLTGFHRIPLRPATPTASTPATPRPDLDERTSKFHAALEARLGMEVYGAWFTTLRVEDVEGDRLTVSVTSPFLK